jgi:cysteine desulfurase
MHEPIYLDHAATTPLRDEAREAMDRVVRERWGNPSSVHTVGRAARAALEEARERFATVIGAAPGEIVFTRGGTEADNLAVLGLAGVHGGPAACSAVEHSAVLRATGSLGGTRALLLPVDADGVVLAGAVDEALAAAPALVAVLWAGNEVGVVQPVEEIAGRCAAAGVPFHTDAVQALGKVPVRMDRVAATTAAFSGHKLGGPRGAGALFLRRGTALAPVLHGGGQERGVRPGTEDVAAAVGLAVAAERAEAEREGTMSRVGALRDRLESGLRDRIPGLRVNGGGADRVPHILNVSLPEGDAELLLAGLDLEGIAASSGSACASGAFRPSHVLLAMGLPPGIAGPSLRFSLGRGTTASEIERVLEVLPALARRPGVPAA